MKSIMKKTTLREIRQSLGRYLAIFAIVALGVGFFAGLKITKAVMIESANDYLQEYQLFDYRLLSTLGFQEEDVQALRQKEHVRAVEGAVEADILYLNETGNEGVLKAHTLLEQINGVKLTAGRIPQSPWECIVDSNRYDETALGSKIILSENNSSEDMEKFAYREYTVVGVAQASAYIQFERGNSSLGNGRVDGFMYLLPGGFATEYYTDIYVKFDTDERIYSAQYDAYMAEQKSRWEQYCREQGERRYQALVGEAETELAEAGKKIEEARAELSENRQTLADAREELIRGREDYDKARAELEEQIAQAEQEIAKAETDIASIKKPDTYVLGRDTNVGYTLFENDSSIVEGIANVFPVFFFLVAALVCMTTMNRMVEEQRTQIGVLKALGYGNGKIMGKYLFYSGSAALGGCVTGYFLGIFIFPLVIWQAYGMMYRLGDILFVFDWAAALLCLTASLLCSMGTTWISCRHELKTQAAGLMRPKAPKAGKRILLERMGFIWNRLKFLHKVSVRNIVRYKKRLFMMVMGISGCTALLVTGFGVRDSVTNIADQQYAEIQTYQLNVTLSDQDGKTEDAYQELSDLLDSYGGTYTYAFETSLDMLGPEGIKSVSLIVAADPAQFEDFVDLHTSPGEKLSYPGDGEIILCNKLAEQYRLKVGDTVRLMDESRREFSAVVSGICENYIFNYVYMNRETCEKALGDLTFQNLYVNLPEDTDVHEVSAAVMNAENVASVQVNEDMRVRFSSMMSSMNYIVFLVIGCAAALAFIVLYNLNNINITERIREIATIKVLGFYRNETSSYVFRENTVLTAIGCALGLLLGKLLHIYVMHEVNIDMISFDVHVTALSYFLSVLLTFAFTWIVNRIMAGKLDRINMAESLKSVD